MKKTLTRDERLAAEVAGEDVSTPRQAFPFLPIRWANLLFCAGIKDADSLARFVSAHSGAIPYLPSARDHVPGIGYRGWIDIIRYNFGARQPHMGEAQYLFLRRMIDARS